MVITNEENEVIVIMVTAYKKHLLNIYGGKPNKSEELISKDEMEDRIYDIMTDLEDYEIGDKPYTEIHLGILYQIKYTLEEYDITNEEHPLATVLVKTDEIIKLRTISEN